ncbi:MAG: SRPBCC family protein [Planctomycetes bacterium]|nr:SRPBCC family protein [Planctomycetota bacterium]
MPQFESRTSLSASPEQVFDYILHPANLQAIAPPETQFVYVSPPPRIELGSRLTCKVSAYGMIQQLSYEIVELVSPVRYREKMVEGPLKLWLHDYIVEPVEGGVILINRIEFEPPGGMMGLIVNASRIQDALEDGFDHRAKALQKVFG